MDIQYEVKLARRFEAAREAARGEFQLHHLIQVLDGVKADLDTVSEAPFLYYNITHSSRGDIRTLAIDMLSKTSRSRRDHIHAHFGSDNQPSVIGPQEYYDTNSDQRESYTSTPDSFSGILGKIRGTVLNLTPAEKRPHVEEIFAKHKKAAFHPCSAMRVFQGFCNPGPAAFQR